MLEESFAPTAWDDIDGVIPPAQSRMLLAHETAANILTQNYRNNRLHHAWLLSGPKGIGKATLAFRFAEHLLRNPESASAPESLEFLDDPVHSQVAKGAHPNILVLRKPYDQKTKKFKTRITVDEIRKTASFLQSASAAESWRIVIVDPADDMNASAANALLKILEEPPARTLFFVIAHSPRGLLPTIRSRCQSLTLKPLNEIDLIDVLKHQPICSDLTEEELVKLAALAKGSVRRALQLTNSNILEIYSGFLELITAKTQDIGQLHRLAGMLSPAAKSVEYGLFMDLIYDHIADRMRDMAKNDQVPLKQVSRWSDIWDKTREANARAETWNMDKKQVILDLYKELRAA